MGWKQIERNCSRNFFVSLGNVRITYFAALSNSLLVGLTPPLTWTLILNLLTSIVISVLFLSQSLSRVGLYIGLARTPLRDHSCISWHLYYLAMRSTCLDYIPQSILGMREPHEYKLYIEYTTFIHVVHIPCISKLCSNSNLNLSVRVLSMINSTEANAIKPFDFFPRARA